MVILVNRYHELVVGFRLHFLSQCTYAITFNCIVGYDFQLYVRCRMAIINQKLFTHHLDSFMFSISTLGMYRDVASDLRGKFLA